MLIDPEAQQKELNTQSLQASLRLGLSVVTELWSYSTRGWITGVHVADIDGDGDREVLMASQDGQICVLTKLGDLKWKAKQSKDWVGTVAGIDASTALDETRVVVGSRDNNVYAFDGSGGLIWEYPLGLAARQIIVNDVNQDGKTEIIVGSEDRSIHVLASENGELLWKYPTRAWIRAIFTCDIDNDGAIEVLSGSGDKFLYVLDSFGKLKWKYDANSKIYALHVADLDNDGTQEILIATDAKDLYALTPDFQKKWEFHPTNRIHSLYVADLDNDGRLEIIAGSEDKHVYFLNEQGELIWKYNVGARVFSVFAIDLDRDGLVEVLVGSEDNTIHVLRVELTQGLRQKMLATYEALGQPLSHTLNFSPTETLLLQDMTDETIRRKHVFTLSELSKPLEGGYTLNQLSMLLELERQKAQILWEKNIGYPRALALGDVIHDQRQEIVFGTGEGNVYVLDTSGNIHWSYSLSDRIRAVQIGDIDQDGKAEILVGSIDGYVYALNNTGKIIKWQSRMNDWITSICIGQTHAHSEVVMSSEDRKLYVYSQGLTMLPEVILTPQGIQIVYTEDINEDGVLEIIAGAVNDNVYAYSRDNMLLWSYKTKDRVRSLSVKDIDGDGQKEIIVGSEDRSVHVLDSSGKLKWRYYTQHRVLDVAAMDVDQDGRAEILVGGGDGQIYVLSSDGDLLWQYQMDDRVRLVQATDIDQDGNIEIIVGSEDRIYMLQMLKAEQVWQLIETCWQDLCSKCSLEEVLITCAQHPLPSLRSFAVRKFAHQPELLAKKSDVLQAFVNDPSWEVRCAFAQHASVFYRSYPDIVRRFFDGLSGDPKREVRLSFVESLSAIIDINPDLVFAYFDRFTRSIDLWVRQGVVRKLYRLASSFPQPVFRLLLVTTQDEAEWIRQESARTLAHYFDLHTDTLIVGARSLLSKGVDVSVYDLISHRTTNSVIQNVFKVIVNLFSDLNETNVQERLQAAVFAFEKTKTIKHGEEMWYVYHELERLMCMRNIEEIARYKYIVNGNTLSDTTYFEETLQIFQRLAVVARALETYLRRDGLGDRLASLLEATAAIETIFTNTENVYVSSPLHKLKFLDGLIFELLVKRWRSIIAAELVRLRGKAELRPELQTKQVQREAQVGVWLNIYNDGNSPADNVKITLQPGEAFAIVTNSDILFETIPSRDSVLAEFTIEPYDSSPHLVFEIVYNDAGTRDEKIMFGERLALQNTQRPFQRTPNPYLVGAPVQSSDMFYGREEDLAFLSKNLTSTSANVAIVFYGQRRSGKTSLLYQLVNTSILEPHIPVRIDMQDEALDINTSKFLRSIAYKIYKALKAKNLEVNKPTLDEYKEDPRFVFNIFLDDVEEVLKERKLVLLIDEFEVLEQKVNEKALPREIFDYLRSLMQHRQSINFLLAGTHTLEELTMGYWSVFFNIARHYRLSKLTEDAATRLITQPVSKFLEFDSFAVMKIRQLTADQPYLIQLICRSLVDHANILQKSYITINDVNIVLDEVMATGEIHFKWIWEQAVQEERIVLSILAQEGGEKKRLLSLADIEENYRHHGLHYNYKKVLQALHSLQEKDIIESTSNGTRFQVVLGLSQRWLRETKSIRRVMLEENL